MDGGPMMMWAGLFAGAYKVEHWRSLFAGRTGRLRVGFRSTGSLTREPNRLFRVEEEEEKEKDEYEDKLFGSQE